MPLCLRCQSLIFMISIEIDTSSIPRFKPRITYKQKGRPKANTAEDPDLELPLAPNLSLGPLPLRMSSR